jgi:CDP-paratose synthetase
VTFRLYPPYGSYDNKRKLIPHTIKSFYYQEPLKLTSGKQRWDYIHVSDIIEAYVKLLDVSHFQEVHQIFNIGSGKAFSIREVIKKIQQIMNVDEIPEWGAYPQRENEVMFLCADIEKARQNLIWQPKTTLAEGLESTVGWFVEYFSKQRSKDGKEN